MGLRVTGLAETLLELARTEKRTNRAALNALRNGAHDIAERASDYAPVDEGFLERSIVVEEQRGGGRRIEFLVGVDHSRLGPGYSQYGFDYALEMHEGSYDLGKRSQAKAASLGVSVGPKYLERAMHDFEEEIRDNIEAAIEKEIK